MRDIVFPVVWVVTILTIMSFAVLHLRRAKKLQAEEDEQHRLAIEDGIKKKVLLPNGKPACLVCQQAVATESWPVIQRSWLDKVTVFKDLYALTPRYSIRDGEGDDYAHLLCRHHKRMCVQKWNELLSSKRTQIQAIFSQIEADLAQMEGGAMLLYLRSQHEHSMEKLVEFLGGPSVARPILRSVNDDHDAPISMPPMTTENGKEKAERTN